MDEIYYTKKEDASIFKRTTKTIDVWTKLGRIHAYKFGNTKQSRIFYKKTEIDRLMEEL